jgi:hypothetical protein
MEAIDAEDFLSQMRSSIICAAELKACGSSTKIYYNIGIRYIIYERPGK